MTYSSCGLALMKIVALRSVSSCILSSSKDKSLIPGFICKKIKIKGKAFCSVKDEDKKYLKKVSKESIFNRRLTRELIKPVQNI